MLSVLPDYVYGAVLPGLQKDGREVVFAPSPDRSLVRKSISAAGLPKDTKVLKFKDGSMLNGVVLCGLEVDKYYENVPKDLLERAKGDCRVRRYSSMYGRRNLDEWLRPKGYLAKADKFGVQYALANAGFPVERVGCLWGNDGVLYVNDINTYVMLQSGIGAIVWEGSCPVSEFLRTNTYVTVDGVDDMVKSLSGDQLSVAGLYAFEWDGAKLEPHVVDGETFVHYLEANGFPVLPANEWMPFSEAVAALNKSKEEVEKFLKRVEEEGITASRNEGGTRWVSKDAVKSYADVASKGIRAAIREASKRAGEFVEMAQSAQDADERVKAAEKRALEAEKKASEAEAKLADAEKQLADSAGEAEAKLADAEKRVSEAEAKLADASRKRVEAEETARGYSRQLGSLRAENESYRSEAANWKKRAEGLEKEKSEWEKSRSASVEEVTALQMQVAELSGQLDDAKAKIKSGSSDYAKLYTENQDSKRALEEMEGKLGILQTSAGSFEKRRAEYESTIADLKGKVAEAKKERDAVERKFGTLQRKHGNLVKSNDRVLKENAELSERVSALRRNVESLQCSLGDVQTPALSGPVRYGFGDDCDFEAVIVDSSTLTVVMSPEMASALEVLGM